MIVCPTILLADDDKNVREGLREFLESLGFDVLPASDGREAWEMFQAENPDLVLADIRMPEIDGIQLLDLIQAKKTKSAVILLTAYGSVEDAVKAMKRGAYYYLTKPVNLEELEFLVKKALTSQQLAEENKELRHELFKEKFEQGEIITSSATMLDVLRTTDQIAKTHSTVLIEGESGTGKELIAHRIHAMSLRSQKPFVAVHCAALSETLLASELFGHEKGSFTGATERKIGRFERAHEGTLFLDEIGEISPDMQVKLLRVIQEGEFERVGGGKTIKVNVRLVCATNRKLIEEVRQGRFREDLYYRINVIYLHVPPLRERKEDIAILVESFVKHFSRLNNKKITRISDEVIDGLKKYDWPGNIRELKNIVERMVVLSQSDYLALANVPEDIRGGGVASKFSNPSSSSPDETLSDLAKSHIEQVLSASGGNKSLAAKKLGISRRTLYRKLDEYKL